MKLLVCSSEYFPPGAGIANVLFNIVENLKGQGVECTVCSPTGPDIKLGNKKLIEKCGIVGLIYYWYQVSKYFKKNDYDVIWFNQPYLITKFDLNNVIVTIYSTYFGESSIDISSLYYLQIYKKISSFIERFCFNNLKSGVKITVDSPTVMNELVNYGFDISSITVIPNGVNTDIFSPYENKYELRKKLGLPDNDIILLYVGRLTIHKQPLELIEIFSQLEQKMKSITLCIVGKGELFNKIQFLITTKKIDRVLLLGYVSQKDLPSLYACSDYYVMPSKYEGGMPPLTLAEAMASGLPCIVSVAPSLGDVKAANCGIVVNFKDSAHTLDIIIDYLKGGMHLDHAKNAREYAIQFLDWRIISKQYLKIFQMIQAFNYKKCNGNGITKIQCGAYENSRR